MERHASELGNTQEILVVDDEANVADVVAGALRLVGYESNIVGAGPRSIPVPREPRSGTSPRSTRC